MMDGRTENRTADRVLLTVASATVLIMLLIFVFILTNGMQTMKKINLFDFITGSEWAPLSGKYGAAPLITGTLLVTAGAMVIALPTGIVCAAFISEVAGKRSKEFLKPVCEVLAGIPSVVYGFVGLVVLVPLLRNLFPGNLLFGSSWLAGSIILGIMALPTVISVSNDALMSVPRSYREASLALGATRWETTWKIVIPAASSGIAAASILGIGRAIGETMAVMMVTGNSAMFPEPLWNIFSLVRTLTATIALEMPESVTGGLHQSSLFVLALILMVIILAINLTAKHAIKRSSYTREESFLAKRIGTENATRMRKTTVFSIMFLVTWALLSLFSGPGESLIKTIAVCVVLWLMHFALDRMERKNVQTIAHTTMGLTMASVIVVLTVIIWNIVSNGISVISWDFITGLPSNGGREGGIYPAIVGTLKLIAGTMFTALPLGVLTGIYLAEYSKENRISGIIRNAIDILNGTPSIVFGLFGMSVFVIAFGWNFSLIGGSLTLSLMVLPTIIRTTEEAIKAVPKELMEASMALGATKWQTICKVIVPSALGGIITGTILSLGRAAGETAPIMLTAAIAFQRRMSVSMFDPVMALPYHLYYLSAEVPGSTALQYGTALTLMIIVLTLFGSASVVRYYFNKKNGI